MQRPEIPERIWNNVCGAVINELDVQRKKKGDHSLLSTHEIFGVVQEEVLELAQAVQANDLQSIRNELLDIAVSAILGIASIDNESLHW